MQHSAACKVGGGGSRWGRWDMQVQYPSPLTHQYPHPVDASPEMAETEELSARLRVSSIASRPFTRTNLRKVKAGGLLSLSKNHRKAFIMVSTELMISG